MKYAQNLESFLAKIAKDRTQELETLKSQRRDDIKQRLESAGWNKRDWLFPLEAAEKWVKLAEAPKPLTDRTWESMYPKLVPYLEANRKQYLERAPQDRYRRRERRLRALLVGIKRKDIVFKVERSVLKAQAGGSTTPDDIASFTESDQDECESEDDWPHNQPIALSVFALRLPFPPMVEIFKFPSILPLVENDVDAGSLEILFDEARDDLQEAIQSWRSKVEGELLGVLQAGVKTTPCSDLVLNFSLPPKYAEAISDLSPLLHTLLRADTVFRVIDDRVCPPPLYYPELFSIYQDHRYGHFLSWGGRRPWLGRTWSTSNLRRYDEGITAAKAILNELGRKDAAQFELQCLGAIFSCGQCSDKTPRTWNQIVHHHTKALSRAHAYERCTDPIKSSTTYNDPHTIGSRSQPQGKSKPLVIMHTSEEAKALSHKRRDPKSAVRCNLCSQLGISFVDTRPVVLKHAKVVHSVVNPKANVYSNTHPEDPSWHYVPRRWERVSSSSGETEVATGSALESRIKDHGVSAYWADLKWRLDRSKW
ncbi:hypothetical protein FRC12_019496 [Ceratobasidium sp. 428]|nr:hypothetical protein FRC12_019496 [Ceratobasidium sp. 428]